MNLTARRIASQGIADGTAANLPLIRAMLPRAFHP
jgi:hypothetical protein